MYLLDTHAILWFLSGDARLSDRARDILETEKALYFSPVSLWEIGIKLGLKKTDFQLDSDWWRSIPQSMIAQGIQRLDLLPEHFRDVAFLPMKHRDPFDRMLIVQAKYHAYVLLSADQKLRMYNVKVEW
jgi:PIN domain nuclease of toxin-antitoxin system